MSGRRLLMFCLAMPLALALYNGIRGSIWAPDLGPIKTFLMFASCSVPLWAISGGVAYVLLQIVRKTNGHPILALAGSAIFAVPLSYVLILLFIIFFSASFPGLEHTLEPDGRALVGGFAGYVSGATGLMIIPLWGIAHWLYEAATGEVVFFRGFIKAVDASPRSTLESLDGAPRPDPEFVKKLRPELGRSILALEAQEHYIKVHTDHGHELIHYRFGDAVQQLTGTPGLQVHRSYWVAEDAVVAIEPVGKSYRLTLRNGLAVPVSLSYRGALQQHRLLAAAVREPKSA